MVKDSETGTKPVMSILETGRLTALRPNRTIYSKMRKTALFLCMLIGNSLGISAYLVTQSVIITKTSVKSNLFAFLFP
jgi:hypothetical protein